MFRTKLIIILPLVVAVTVGQVDREYSYNGVSQSGRPVLVTGPVTVAPEAPIVPAPVIDGSSAHAAPRPLAVQSYAPALRPRPHYTPKYVPLLPSRPIRPAPPAVAPSQPAVTTQSPPAQGLRQLNFDFECINGNGYYAVEHECDTYIECKHNTVMKYTCPDGLHFNPAAKHNEYPCAYASEVQCLPGYQERAPESTAECPNQYGFFSMKNGDCSQYIRCNRGFATIMKCPKGLAFNPQTSTCDWPANVPQCNLNALKDVTCPAPSVDKDGQISDIVYNYRYKGQCKLFIACQLGHPRLLSCESGLSFDDASQTCIDEDYVQDCSDAYPEHLH